LIHGSETLLFGMVRSGRKMGESREHEGNSLRLPSRVVIGHLQVRVRAGRVPTIPKKREPISPVNMIALERLDASSLQMGISDKKVLCNLKNNVVSNESGRDRRNSC